MSRLPNATDTDEVTSNQTAQIAVAVAGQIFACAVLFGIAASVNFDQMRESRKHIGALCIGLASQWLIMPAIAFAFATAFGLEDHVAFTLICLGAAPGGVFSNTLAYLGNGDVALSITLTTVTNTLAIGTVPLLLFLYASSTVEIAIPFGQIILQLALCLIPAAGGIWLKTKRPLIAVKVTRCCAVTGAIVLVLTIVVAAVVNAREIFGTDLLPGNTFLALLLTAPCGMLVSLLGVGAVTLARSACPSLRSRLELGAPQVVTIVLETGIQNVPLALAIVNLTLTRANAPIAQTVAAQVYGGLWLVMTTLMGVVVVVLSRAFGRRAAAKEADVGMQGIEGAGA